MRTGEPRVAVAGAGIGGLTLAVALAAKGIEADVYERAPELTEVGAAVVLSANATRLLAGLGLGGALAKVSTTPAALVYRHGRDGHPIARHAVGDRYTERFGAPMHALHRVDLQQALAGAWRGRIRFGQAVTGIEPGPHEVRLTLSGGDTVRADVVVGADGVHSFVRRWLTDDSAYGAPVYSGTSGFRGLVAAERVPALPDAGSIQFWLGSGAHVLHYPIAGGSVINFLAVVDGPAAWPHATWVVEATPRERLTAFGGWDPRVRELLAASDLPQRWGLFAHRPLHRWSRDRVTLLGDAAHAMLPHHGQGANQTVEDAVLLADLLGGERVEDALAGYERLRRTRTRQVQRASWDASTALHFPDGEAADARDARLAEFGDRCGWIHAHGVRSVSGTRRSR